jgi:hypothetical protein
MLDPLIFITAVGAVSGIGAFGAGRMVLLHHAEIVRGKREPIEDVLQQAYAVDAELPAELRALLEQIDRSDR